MMGTVLGSGLGTALVGRLVVTVVVRGGLRGGLILGVDTGMALLSGRVGCGGLGLRWKVVSGVVVVMLLLHLSVL